MNVRRLISPGVFLLLLVGHLLFVNQLAAAEPWTMQIAEADPVVRNGLLWRCRISGEIPTSRFALGPYTAQVSLTQGADIIATQDYPLTRLGQLLTGIDVVLMPNTPALSDAPVLLAVTVSDPSRRDLQHLTRTLPTPLGLQRGLERRQRLVQERGDQDPLPALWLEQAGELMLGGSTISTCQQLEVIGAQLDHWLANERVDVALRALRDPIDGSVQPYRVHLPSESPTTLVVVLADLGPGLQKSAWPTLPEPWIAAARAAGCAVLEVYPAGDLAWSGIALPRVWTTIAAARATDARLQTIPLAVVGAGRGAAGAVALAENQPGSVRALGVIDGRLPVSTALPVDPRERWRALQRVGERPAHLLGTSVSLSDCKDADVLAWSRRLVLAGHPQVGDAGSAANVEFWRSLNGTNLSTTRREWVVLAPMAIGALRIEELSDWGLAGSLTQDAQGNLRTFGIGRLRLEPAGSVTVDGRAYRDPAKPAAAPRKMLGQAMGPLSAYAMAPFTVVIGSGESAAALTDNRTLAQAFAGAWAAHAHGRIRVVEDSAVTDESLPGQNLVLIGNPRSNLVLARWASRSALPVQWDARSLTVSGNRSTSFLRADRRAFALAWPHPAHDGRLLVILDGRPAWRSHGLPLADLPDLFIGGPQAEDPPAVELTYGNDWR